MGLPTSFGKFLEYVADKAAEFDTSVRKHINTELIEKESLWNGWFAPTKNSEFSVNAGKSIDLWVSQYSAQTFEQQQTLQRHYVNILEEETVNLEQLRSLTQYGIPQKIRAPIWQLSIGYLPLRKSERKATLNKRRKKYWDLVEQLYPKAEAEQSDPLLMQIAVDVLRTFPTGLEKLFERQPVKNMLTRILYIYSVKHQRTNYWQGLNELPIPFIANFFSFYVGCTLEQLNQISLVSVEQILKSGTIEADVYGCLIRFVNSLQRSGDYVIEKYGTISPGALLDRLFLLSKMVNTELHENLQEKNVEYVHFAFRWMVCMLIREIPISTVVRLWDNYLSEGESMLSFHLYTTCSFLQTFTEDIIKLPSFDQTLVFVQNLPTDNWNELHAEYLIKRAYQIKIVDAAYRKSAAGLATVFVVALVAAMTLVAYQRCLEAPHSPRSA